MTKSTTQELQFSGVIIYKEGLLLTCLQEWGQTTVAQSLLHLGEDSLDDVGVRRDIPEGILDRLDLAKTVVPVSHPNPALW